MGPRVGELNLRTDLQVPALPLSFYYTLAFLYFTLSSLLHSVLFTTAFSLHGVLFTTALQQLFCSTQQSSFLHLLEQ